MLQSMLAVCPQSFLNHFGMNAKSTFLATLIALFRTLGVMVTVMHCRITSGRTIYAAWIPRSASSGLSGRAAFPESALSPDPQLLMLT